MDFEDLYLMFKSHEILEMLKTVCLRHEKWWIVAWNHQLKKRQNSVVKVVRGCRTLRLSYLPPDVNARCHTKPALN